MSPELTFFFYLAALVFFLLGALYPKVPRISAVISQLSLVAFGLASAIVPTVWAAYELAF